MNDLDFAALLCSRLCHDLISPVGAISNGIEILSDEDDESMRLEVMKLLELSAGQTSNRLKFYRLAFGAAGGIGDHVPIRDAKNAAEQLFDGTPINLTWNSEVGEMDKSAVKVILNMILVASEALIRGGELIVNVTINVEKLKLEISAKADRIIFQDKAREMICGETELTETDPKIAPAYLAASIAKQFNSKIHYTSHDDGGFALEVLI
ncbi:MAG: histidine phosphotransferase [Kordiimonadaceae bacterium]|jgi:histidine phosphotransferase ChpT|nr:histidine phosphotransferase [Kordiimonadaceae bacterium]MBT7583151.1 histidine phosphotransferase [Kordiimonadaceae bacterium]